MIERIIKNKKEVNQYTKQLIKNLIKKGKINRLTKGYYSIYNDTSIAVYCFKPAYLGLQDALSFHNLWEQETIPVLITTKKIRQGIRKITGSNLLIKRINKRYFFGYNYQKEYSFYLPYSDIEKTLIDMIYFRQKINDATKEEIIKKIDVKKLNSYLKIYPKIFQKKVLNFVNK